MTGRSNIQQCVLNALPAGLLAHAIRSYAEDFPELKSEKGNSELATELYAVRDSYLGGSDKLKKTKCLVYNRAHNHLIDWLIAENHKCCKGMMIVILWAVELENAGAIDINEGGYGDIFDALANHFNELVDEDQAKSIEKQVPKFHNAAKDVVVI